MKTENRILKSCEMRVEGDGENRKLVGLAVPYGETTKIGGMFRETFQRSVFSRALSERQDIRALWNHNRDIVLGRSVVDTLRLKESKRGLEIEIDLPNSPNGENAREAIERGDVSGMSITFKPVKQEWSESDNKDGELRTIVDADLFEVSPVTFPQYTSTSIELRSTVEEYEEHRKSQERQGDAQEREKLRLKLELLTLEEDNDSE